MSRGRWSRSHGSSRWSPWRWETYRKSAPSMRASRSSSSWSLRGNGNHEPKNAGTNHGSHTIEPWSDSMRMPAWPSDVARIIARRRYRWGRRRPG